MNMQDMKFNLKEWSKWAANDCPSDIGFKSPLAEALEATMIVHIEESKVLEIDRIVAFMSQHEPMLAKVLKGHILQDKGFNRIAKELRIAPYKAREWYEAAVAWVAGALNVKAAQEELQCV